MRDNWRTVRLGDIAEKIEEQEHDPVGAGLERFLKVEHMDADSLRIRRWGIIGEEELPHPRYWSYLFNTAFWRRKVESLSGGTTRLRISRKNLESIKVPFPTRSYQEQSANTLAGIDAALDAWTLQLDRTLGIKRGLLSDLMAGTAIVER